ncbi:MAG: hypothetical protein IJ272_02015 [Clostridia bacterium]|nr:hypothetical protein [Clostridia bacterium]
MRKMKRLFKARNRFMPWYHWSIIHFTLNAISMLALYVTSFFTENTELLINWFTACVIQLFPFLIVLFVDWIFEKKLAKNALSIIKKKLEESKVNFKDIDITITEHRLYSCTMNVNRGISTVKQANEFSSIVHDTNRKLGNGYNITYVTSQYESTEHLENSYS